MTVKYYEDFTVGIEETVGNYVVDKQEIIDYAKKMGSPNVSLGKQKGSGNYKKNISMKIFPKNLISKWFRYRLLLTETVD
ncbi:MAG: hypothetical protein FP814_11680 [Desulfobacterium sp.]|nr:hypothetical protein [Desulfobacterium sp.]